MNVHSPEWHIAATRVRCHDNIIGGDQSGQDITIPRMFTKYFSQFLQAKFHLSKSWTSLIDG